jgi:hypothetical protein
MGGYCRYQRCKAHVRGQRCQCAAYATCSVVSAAEQARAHRTAHDSCQSHTPPPLRDALWSSWPHITCFAGSVLRSCNAHMQWRGYGCCTGASTVAIRCTVGLGTPCSCHPSTVSPRHLGTCSCKFSFVTKEATRDVASLVTSLNLLL